MSKKTELLVITNRVGYIPQLRMCGPILQPISVPSDVCVSMVSSGVALYVVDPETKTNMRLTPQNIAGIIAGDPEPVVAAPVQVEKNTKTAPKNDAPKAPETITPPAAPAETKEKDKSNKTTSK